MCQPSRCSLKGGVDTRRCASKDAWPQTGWILGAVPPRLEEGKSASEDAGPRRGWIVMFHIDWGGEQATIYKGVETFSWQTRFKAWRGSPKEKV